MQVSSPHESLPRSALTTEVVTASHEQPLRGVVIGLGHQGLKHAQTILAHPDAILAGAADPGEQAQALFGQSFPETSVPVSADVSSLLEALDEPPDFAVVAVTHDAYPDIIKELCHRGLPFLKEKPFARNLAEADELLGITSIAQYCYTATQRSHSQLERNMNKLLELAPEPTYFRYIYTLGRSAANIGWRSDLARAGGGSLLDMGYHVLARVYDWFGQPDSVQTVLGVHGKIAGSADAEDLVSLLLSYDSGLYGWVVLSPTSTQKEESFLISFPGTFVAGTANQAAHYTEHGHPVYTLGAAEEDLTASQLTHFLQKVRSGEGFAEDQQRQRAIMALIEKCYQSRPKR
ncbi:MAG TPA: Gfo/Idh/MocA family oxidoreductase [Candidatus Pristimantibacillus sp.]|nr:Gfo/Idh/MocA family oxidoreductase [Candidatus Pristimantibacillus sp.]